MSLEYEDILSGMVNVVKSLIGTSLSTVKGQGGSSIPFVVKSLQKPPVLSYPYAVVGLLSPTSTGYSTSDEYFNDDDDYVYQFNTEVPVFIDIHATQEKKSTTIATELRQRIFTRIGTELICSNLTDGGLLDVADPIYSFHFMDTDFEEVTRLVVTLSVANTIVDATQDYIETAETNGTYTQ